MIKSKSGIKRESNESTHGSFPVLPATFRQLTSELLKH